MVDSIKREDDPPTLDLPDDISLPLVKDLEALSLKQDSTDVPIKEVNEVSRIVPKNIVFRRGKPKGDTFTSDQLAQLLLPRINKFFLAEHDDGSLEIYCWTTPGVDLGHLYRVDPFNGAFADRTDATQVFTIGNSTYEPNIQNQTLILMRSRSEYQRVHFFLDFQTAQTRYFHLALQNVAVPPNLLSNDPVDSGTEPPHPPHSASSQQEISTTRTNASASGSSPACNMFGIPESDLASTPMVLRVPQGVNPEDPANASDHITDYAKWFKGEYNKRGDKALGVSCYHCSESQKELRPTSLARHLRPHCKVQNYACDRCEQRCNTQQQLDIHKTNNHGVPEPKPKTVKSKVVKAKVIKAKAAKLKAAKGGAAKH